MIAVFIDWQFTLLVFFSLHPLTLPSLSFSFSVYFYSYPSLYIPFLSPRTLPHPLSYFLFPFLSSCTLLLSLTFYSLSLSPYSSTPSYFLLPLSIQFYSLLLSIPSLSPHIQFYSLTFYSPSLSPCTVLLLLSIPFLSPYNILFSSPFSFCTNN